MRKIRLNLFAVTLMSLFFHSMATPDTPSGVGDMISNDRKIQLNLNTAYSANAELNVKETALYRIYTWMFGVGKSDGSYYAYEVLADGLKIGTISPRKGNWQLIGLDGDKPIALKNGIHNIEIRSADKLTPQVESIYLTQESIETEKLSANYDRYLERARQTAAEHAKTTFEYPKERQRKQNVIKAGIVQKVELPLPYSYFTIRSFKKGDDIKLTSKSATSHIIDVEIYGNPQKNAIVNPINERTYNSQNLTIQPPVSRYDTIFTIAKPHIFCSSISEQERQGLGWYFPAERSPKGQYYTALGKIKIMQDGFYLIRLRSCEPGVVSTADLNIDDKDFYTDVPISYSEYICTLPANDKSYTVSASSQYFDADPMLFVCGADADRLVGYNDDCTQSDKTEFGLLANSACLTQKYLVTTSTIDVLNYFSKNPELTCSLKVGETETMRKTIRKSKEFGQSSVSGIGISEDSYSPQIHNSENYLLIISDRIIKHVAITTVEGFQIMQIVPNDYEAEIYTGDLCKGRIYFLYIRAEDGSRHCSKFYLK